MMKFQVNRQHPERGVTVVDYSLMVGLLAIVIIVALGVLG
jgi:Flp pilus assembly pilin Flp